MFEFLLTKIAGMIFGKAAAASAISSAATAYEVYSVVDSFSDATDCIETTNGCNDLGVSGIQVIGEYASDRALDKFLEAGSGEFSVTRRDSGVYIASRFAPTFRAANLSFPTPTIVLPGSARTALPSAHIIAIPKRIILS